jgi:hypothetical protein
MSEDLIPQDAVDVVASYLHKRSTKSYSIPVIGSPDNIETPQVFEIMPFDKIDDVEPRFYAIDGSYNNYDFYNGLGVGLYRAGYVCFKNGKPVRMNASDNPVILGKTYMPTQMLTGEAYRESIYDELIEQPPVVNLLEFFDQPAEEVFPYPKEIVCSSASNLLRFCQEILEWALVLEIVQRDDTSEGDFILRDGTLRSLNIKQKFLVNLGKMLHQKKIRCVAITKQSPLKIELSYTFTQIDNYLQDDLHKRFPFAEKDHSRQRLCCFLEVRDDVLAAVYGRDRGGGMFGKKDITGGRGFGLFFAARLDYVEKLQNYDWVIVDLNIFDCIPSIEQKSLKRDIDTIKHIMYTLTSLTQEHSILGYPYPLVEVHNLVSIRSGFQEEMIARVKHSLYQTQRMDHTEIENFFLDTHNRF